MGADITFRSDGESFYFRDAYNPTNLAWVIGLSYWQTDGSIEEQKRFFVKLSKISDAQIKKYVDKLYSDPKYKDQINRTQPKSEWVTSFKSSRDDIKRNLEIIRNATDVEWSV